jgi:hypothetical protein
MKKLTSHDQEIIANMVYRHQMELHKAYPGVFNTPNMQDIRHMVIGIIPLDLEYRPMEGVNSGNIATSQKLKGNKNGLGWQAKHAAKK